MDDSCEMNVRFSLEAVISYVRFQVFTAVNMKNAVSCDVTPCSSCKNDVSKESSTCIITVTRINELEQHWQ
jgi:hypothetical protein